MAEPHGYIGMWHKLSYAKLIGDLTLEFRLLIVPSMYGYIAGGNTTYVKTVDRITFAGGIGTCATSPDLIAGRSYMSGVSDCVNYGYFAGGNTGAAVKTVERITFANGAGTCVTSGAMASASPRYGSAGVSDGSSYGYVAGGIEAAGVKTVDRITFSVGTWNTSTTYNLAGAGRYYLAGVSDGVNYGYISGGNTGAAVKTVDRITFTGGAGTCVTTADLEGTARSGLAGVSGDRIYGYVGGGSSRVVDRITYAIGVWNTSTTYDLTSNRLYCAGSSDGAIYGYFAGGTTGAIVKTVDRITFSGGVGTCVTSPELAGAARLFSAGLADHAV